MQTPEAMGYLRAILVMLFALCMSFHVELQAGPGSLSSEISQPARSPTIITRKARFRTTPLISIFRNEELGESKFFGKSRILYLNDAQREVLKVQIIGGKLYDSRGRLLNSKGKKFIYVMDEDGQIYISPFHSVGLFHHSSILAGKAVAAAGEIIIKDGEVEFIDNRSGHYQPSLFFAAQILKRLREVGVPIKSHEWLGEPEHKTYFDKIFSELSKNIINSPIEDQLVFNLIKTFDSRSIAPQWGETMLARLEKIRPTSNLLAIMKMIELKPEILSSNDILLTLLNRSLTTKIPLLSPKKTLSKFLKIQLKNQLFKRMDPFPSINRGLVKFDPDFAELQMIFLQRNPDLALKALQLLLKIQSASQHKDHAPSNLQDGRNRDCLSDLIRLSSEKNSTEAEKQK